MDDQLRVVTVFMDMVDSKKEEMRDQDYLDLCAEIQLTHTLITHQPTHFCLTEDATVISARAWRYVKRSHFLTMSNVVRDIETRRRKRIRLLTLLATATPGESTLLAQN